MVTNRFVLNYKFQSLINEIAQEFGVSLREAMDIMYKSQTYTEMREGLSDMHCRSDKYLVEEIRREGTNESQ
jgi:hypothetical protein